MIESSAMEGDISKGLAPRAKTGGLGLCDDGKGLKPAQLWNPTFAHRTRKDGTRHFATTST